MTTQNNINNPFFQDLLGKFETGLQNYAVPTIPASIENLNLITKEDIANRVGGNEFFKLASALQALNQQEPNYAQASQFLQPTDYISPLIQEKFQIQQIQANQPVSLDVRKFISNIPIVDENISIEDNKNTFSTTRDNIINKLAIEKNPNSRNALNQSLEDVEKKLDRINRATILKNKGYNDKEALSFARSDIAYQESLGQRFETQRLDKQLESKIKLIANVEPEVKIENPIQFSALVDKFNSNLEIINDPEQTISAFDKATEENKNIANILEKRIQDQQKGSSSNVDSQNVEISPIAEESIEEKRISYLPEKKPNESEGVYTDRVFQTFQLLDNNIKAQLKEDEGRETFLLGGQVVNRKQVTEEYNEYVDYINENYIVTNVKSLREKVKKDIETFYSDSRRTDVSKLVAETDKDLRKTLISNKSAFKSLDKSIGLINDLLENEEGMRAFTKSVSESDFTDFAGTQFTDFLDRVFGGKEGVAKEFQLLFRQLSSAFTLQTMNDLKKLSASGATGFGALSERELGVLSSALNPLYDYMEKLATKSLITTISPDTMKRLFIDMGKAVTNIYEGRQDDFVTKFGYPEPSQVKKLQRLK